MAAKSFFTGALLKSFNFTPNKVVINNSYRTPLVNTAILNLKSYSTATDHFNDVKIPDKPKKPLTPYLRFLEKHRPSIIKENPNLKHVDVIRRCADTWNSLSEAEKEKYKQNYKLDCEKYVEKLSDFNNSLTDEQRSFLEATSKNEKRKRQKRRLRKLFKETNKPKRPVVPFLRFMMEQCKMRNLSLRQLMGDPSLKAGWNGLPEAAKKRYQEEYEKEKKQYAKALEEWEAKMIELGHPKAVRMQTLGDTKDHLPKIAKDHPKPRCPRSAFSMFLLEQQMLRKMKASELRRTLRAEWAEMSDVEKEKYVFALKKEKERYEAELAEWEKTMLEAGHPELIQSKTTNVNRVSRIKTEKGKNTE
ncbi:unnamed protein product [Callosobruchus maculatus]|uniref:HMG box domain-containing protein n=1 Tax=Callosobruchus maculatus TaxID=64391 RepID=A0A653DKM8_CALMS|nr:unnamed protein product [Callosobruchus maculatus]